MIENGDYIVEPMIEALSSNDEYEPQFQYTFISVKGSPIQDLLFSQLKVNLTLTFHLSNPSNEFGIMVSCVSEKHSIVGE